nr:transposase [Streptomyces sp. CB03238]
MPGEPFTVVSRFRDNLFDCLTSHGDELLDVADALLCADGPVTVPTDLTLVAEHRRVHGAMYDALNCANVDAPRLRQVLAGQPQPQAVDGRLVLAFDVSHWIRHGRAPTPVWPCGNCRTARTSPSTELSDRTPGASSTPGLSPTLGRRVGPLLTPQPAGRNARG